jgi:hypothetical protein
VLGLKLMTMTWGSEAAHTPTWVVLSSTGPVSDSLSKPSEYKERARALYAGRAALSTC